MKKISREKAIDHIDKQNHRLLFLILQNFCFLVASHQHILWLIVHIFFDGNLYSYCFCRISITVNKNWVSFFNIFHLATTLATIKPTQCNLKFFFQKVNTGTQNLQKVLIIKYYIFLLSRPQNKRWRSKKSLDLNSILKFYKNTLTRNKIFVRRGQSRKALLLYKLPMFGRLLTSLERLKIHYYI